MVNILHDRGAKHLTHPLGAVMVADALPVALQLVEAIDLFFVPGHQDAAIARLKDAILLYDTERREVEEPRWNS